MCCFLKFQKNRGDPVCDGRVSILLNDARDMGS